MSAINQTIEFIENILSKYAKEIQENNLNDYLFKLNRIKKKNSDPNLYLSVIGEFSSGKSTFINALLREELLESRITQGTTKINTVIRYGKTINMVLNDLKSQESEDLRLIGYSESEIKQRIKNIHLESERAKETSSAVIDHPSDFLRNGIVLIDTPGTNTPELWHEKVTLDALHNLSDASIILTDASQPLPNTLIDFVKENLSGILGRCMFLVTKIDMLRNREREEQLDYIKYTISQKLGIQDPQVYPYSPLLVLESKTECNCSYTKKDLPDILEQSYTSEVGIYNFIKEHKQKILNEKLSSLLEELLKELDKELSTQSTVYKKRHDILLSHTRKKLDDLCPGLFELYCSKTDEYVRNYMNNLNCAFESDLTQAHDAIFNSQNEEQVKNVLSNVNNMVDFRKNDCVRLLEENCNILENISRDTVKFYIDNLNNEYRGLNALMPPNYSNKSLKYNDLKVDDLPDLQVVFPASEMGMKVGGAVAGAALGTMFAPGIGTVIGGALGAFWGFLSSPDLNTFKSQAWKDIYPKILEKYEQISKITSEKITSYINELKRHVTTEISRQKEYHRVKINYLINQDKEEKRILEDNIYNIDCDRAEIKRYINM